MSVSIRVGDCRKLLREMEPKSVHCIITSPPYWGLRDYGVEGAIGSEPTMEDHLDELISVFRWCRHVLRDDGTLWLNYGDSYAIAKAAGQNAEPSFSSEAEPGSRLGVTQNKGNYGSDHRGRVLAGGAIKAKDKLLMPHRVAIALQIDGWYVRQDIVWSKANPMPESVRDRPTAAHEYMFLMSKSERYYYDADAVRTPMKPQSLSRINQATFDQQTGGPKDPKSGNRSHRRTLENLKASRGVPSSWANSSGYAGQDPRYPKRDEYVPSPDHPVKGANLRSVWHMPIRPFKGAHFATFPPDLVKPCILAGCPAGGTVLDPFAGSGTVGLVASQLQRNAILLEMNPKYADIATTRINEDAPLLAGS